MYFMAYYVDKNGQSHQKKETILRISVQDIDTIKMFIDYH